MDASAPPFGIGQECRRAARGAVAGSGLCAQDLFWIALAGSVAAFVLLVLKPDRERLREAEAEARLLATEVAALEERLAHLRGWERSLAAGDREAWVALARGRLGWLGPGERRLDPGGLASRAGGRDGSQAAQREKAQVSTSPAGGR